MADPISAMAAFGAASSFLQIIDFSGKVLYNAAKLMASEDALRENIEIERLTGQHKLLIQVVTESQDWNEGPSTKAAPLVERAKEISEKSGELLKLLDDLKAARAASKRAKISNKKQELESLTKQLELALLLHIASKQADGTALLRNIAQTQADARSHLQDVGAEAFYIYQTITESLNFKEINSRHDTVVDAYGDTYQWAVDAADSKLRVWLAEGNGIFWVCCKPGSGKSTFMKFLLHNPETTSLLGSWIPSGQRLILAGFFFWYLGTSMQKSTYGLLHGMLYKILSECPELIPVACPARLNFLTHRRNAWSQQELLDATDAIARLDCRTKLERGDEPKDNAVRLAFFIDGLDELDGDHRELISVLQRLTAGRRIKVCVSCRPWNVFTSAMADTESALRLEDLTRNDIEHYVRGHLIRAEQSQTDRTHRFRRREPQAEQLVQAVVSKANGVFLWVFLVVRSLIAGFDEGDNIEIVRERLEQLPSELIPYFKLILNRMDKVYQKMTATVLSIAGLPRRKDFSGFQFVSFLDIWPIVDKADHYVDSNFAFEQSLVAHSPDELRQMANETERLIHSTCRDFLQVNQQARLGQAEAPSSLARVQNTRVEFIHRTVYDFLSLSDIHTVLQKLYPTHLEHPSTSSKVALARAKIVPTGIYNDPCQHMDQMASWICFGGPSDRVLKDLDCLEVRYIDEYCTENCPIHVKMPSRDTLCRHRSMCARGHRKAITRTFAQRLGVFKSPSRHTYIEPCESQSRIIRYAFGLMDTSERYLTAEPIELDYLDLNLVQMLVAEGADPDGTITACDSRH